jgi:hypothetical protein
VHHLTVHDLQGRRRRRRPLWCEKDVEVVGGEEEYVGGLRRHVFHEDEGGHLYGVRVEGPVAGGAGRRAGQRRTAYVAEGDLLHRQHCAEKNVMRLVPLTLYRSISAQINARFVYACVNI